MPIHHPLTTEEFYKIVMTDKKQYILVDFYADWCGPCKRISPKLEKMSETYGDSVTFLKVNVDIDELKDIVSRYSVAAMPTFLIFKVGSLSPEFKPIVGADEMKIEYMLKSVSGKLNLNGDF